LTTAIFLIGLPAAGKSTIRTKLLELYPTATVLSTDDVIETESTKEGITYNDGWYKFGDLADKLMRKELRIALTEGKPIIWDQTNTIQTARIKKLRKIPTHYKKVAVVVECSNYNEWRTRLKSRPGKTFSKRKLMQMQESFVYPTEAEGFDEIIKIMT
jgi:predicted kinase